MQCAPSIEVDCHLITPPVRCDAIDFKIVDPTTASDWDRLVASHGGFNFFHRAAWAKVLCRTYGHRPLYLQCYRGTESVALVPMMEVASPFTGRRGVSLPFSDVCEPLVSGEWGREFLTTKLLELGHLRKWRYFELRGGRESLPQSAVPAEKYYGHKLDLRIDLDRLFDSFHSSVRRAIRKAEKTELVAETRTTWDAVTDFYKLHARTRRRHGLPPQPLSFFRNIYKEVIEAGLGFVVLARYRLRPIAAAVFFHSGDEALYKFGASDERLWNVRANNLVMWEGIKQLAGKGLKAMHFGRTDLTDDGLRRFKLSWGTKEQVIEYFRFAIKTQVWDHIRRDGSGLHNQLFGRLPLAVNHLAGTLVYRHLD